MDYQSEILRRRTFAIISHPDAGKTTLTEKLLLYGGAIHVAGAVKSNKIKKTATSDWMEIEKQRGISVATSVMGFDYVRSESPKYTPAGVETNRTSSSPYIYHINPVTFEEIFGILISIDRIVEGHIFYIRTLETLFCKVGCRAAAQYVI